eukprot:COSAG02_NODE_7948_length_2775_cov_2.871076_3_plen_317_part_00
MNNDLCFTQIVREIPHVGTYLRYKFQLLLSVVLLVATSTFYTVSGIDVPAPKTLTALDHSLLGSIYTLNAQMNEVGHKSSPSAQARAFVRANVTIFAQTMLFSGAYGSLEIECWLEPCDGNVWREMFYCAAGLALFFSADAFLSNSLVETADEQRSLSQGTDGDQRSKEAPSRAGLLLRCTAALTGAVVHNTGVWTILDQYVSKHWETCSSADGASTGRISCQSRNLGLVAVGVAMLCASGTLHSNASVSPLATLQVPSNRRSAVAQHQREQLRERLKRAAKRSRVVSSVGREQDSARDAHGRFDEESRHVTLVVQ